MMPVEMTDPEILFLVDCSPEPIGEDGDPVYEHLYTYFGGWRELAYWRLSRKFPRPSEEYEALDKTIYEPEEGFPLHSGSFYSGYNEDIERPSNYDTPHP